jgi:hypothetical protein
VSAVRHVWMEYVFHKKITAFKRWPF